MSADLEALGILHLSVNERLELIENIWNSLPQSVEPSEIPDWHLEIIAKRLADAEAQPGIGRPWREVLGDLGAKG